MLSNSRRKATICCRSLSGAYDRRAQVPNVPPGSSNVLTCRAIRYSPKVAWRNSSTELPGIPQADLRLMDEKESPRQEPPFGLSLKLCPSDSAQISRDFSLGRVQPVSVEHRGCRHRQPFHRELEAGGFRRGQR